MPCSRAQNAKPAFAFLLFSLGRKYGGLAGVAVDRDSSDAVILNAFMRLVRKVGGRMRRIEQAVLGIHQCTSEVLISMGSVLLAEASAFDGLGLAERHEGLGSSFTSTRRRSRASTMT